MNEEGRDYGENERSEVYCLCSVYKGIGSICHNEVMNMLKYSRNTIIIDASLAKPVAIVIS